MKDKMKKLGKGFLYVFVFFTCTLANAQKWMSVYQSDGTMVKYPVAEIDSVVFFQKYVANTQTVDLGLSCLWGTFNVGSTKPEGYGHYFAWGETKEKKEYNYSTYFDNPDNNQGQSKYSSNEKPQLDLEDDVAHIYYGDDWRMPTKDELNELRKFCSWEWITYNGVQGYEVQSQVAGYTNNFIFIPASGYYADTTLLFVDSICNYRSNYYDSFLGGNSSSLSSNSYGYVIDGREQSIYNMFCGFPVRPVRPRETFIPATSISFDKTVINLKKGEQAIIKATIMPSNATNKSPIIGGKVATDGTYKFRATNTGRFTLTASTHNGLSSVCYINVYDSEDPNVIAKQDLDQLYYSFATNVASRGLAFLYAPLRAQYNLMGDDIYAAGHDYGDNTMMSDINHFNFDATADVVNNMYNGFYNAVKETNLLINAHHDATEAPIKKAVAEARTLRAYMYMMLAIGWGTPPLVEYVSDGNDKPYNCDKDPTRNITMTHNELLLWCAKECEKAIPDLDERTSTEDKDGAYKVTKGFAYSVAGKSYLFAGDYQKSKTALNSVITSGKYALVPGDKYWENFHIEGDGNEEKIFEPNLEYDPSVATWSGPNQKSTWMEANLWNWRSDHFVIAPQKIYTGNVDGWGGLGVPQWFGDEFLANDGHSYRFDATLMRIDDAVYGMEYPDATINNLSLAQKKVCEDIGIKYEGLYGQSFYLPFKQLIKGSDTHPNYGNTIRLNNYTIMRYAEVLLMYAEACLKTNDIAGAKSAINQIQKRAGSQTISQTVDMDVLKKEKSYELWLEGCRWADIIRWGDTDRIKMAGQNIPILYDNFTRQPLPSDIDVTWLNNEMRFYTIITNDPINTLGKDGVGFKEGKHELLPYPASVIENNPNITQNPGW